MIETLASPLQPENADVTMFVTLLDIVKLVRPPHPSAQPVSPRPSNDSPSAPTPPSAHHPPTQWTQPGNRWSHPLDQAPARNAPPPIEKSHKAFHNPDRPAPIPCRMPPTTSAPVLFAPLLAHPAQRIAMMASAVKYTIFISHDLLIWLARKRPCEHSLWHSAQTTFPARPHPSSSAPAPTPSSRT